MVSSSTGSASGASRGAEGAARAGISHSRRANGWFRTAEGVVDRLVRWLTLEKTAHSGGGGGLLLVVTTLSLRTRASEPSGT